MKLVELHACDTCVSVSVRIVHLNKKSGKTHPFVKKFQWE